MRVFEVHFKCGVSADGIALQNACCPSLAVGNGFTSCRAPRLPACLSLDRSRFLWLGRLCCHPVTWWSVAYFKGTHQVGTDIGRAVLVHENMATGLQPPGGSQLSRDRGLFSQSFGDGGGGGGGPREVCFLPQNGSLDNDCPGERLKMVMPVSHPRDSR